MKSEDSANPMQETSSYIWRIDREETLACLNKKVGEAWQEKFPSVPPG